VGVAGGGWCGGFHLCHCGITAGFSLIELRSIGFFGGSPEGTVTPILRR
jgi:hypothetical protein